MNTDQPRRNLYRDGLYRKSKEARKRKIWKNVWEFLPIFILVITIFVFRKRLVGVLIPLLIGMIIAFMLEPSVKLVHGKLSRKFKVKRTFSVVIVYVLFLLVIISIISFGFPIVISNVTEILENLDDMQQKLINYGENIVSENHPMIKAKVRELVLELSKKASEKGEKILDAAASFSTYSKISQIVIGIVTTIVFAFYILRDKGFFKNCILGIFPYRFRNAAEETLIELGKISSKFIQGQFFVAVVVGIVECIGLYFIGIPYSLFFGIIGGFSNMIPYFGPFIGAVLPVAVAFMLSPFKAILVIVFFVAVQQIDNHFISPRVIQGNLGVHPLTVIVAIFIGQEFLGIWGILIAAPLYAMIKCIFLRIVKIATK